MASGDTLIGDRVLSLLWTPEYFLNESSACCEYFLLILPVGVIVLNPPATF